MPRLQWLYSVLGLAASPCMALPLLRPAVATSPLPPGSFSYYDQARIDIDGDGRLDLAANPSVWLEHADGSYGPRLEITSPPGWEDSYPSLISDVTGDARADLVGIHRGSFQDPSRLMIAAGRGDLTFEPQSELPFASDLGGIDVADANGDGRLDLVITLLVEIWEYPNNYYYVPFDAVVLVAEADGSFRELPEQFHPFAAFADLNGDGIPDAAGARVRLGLGGGRFGPESMLDGPRWGGTRGDFTVADVDRDGFIDILATNSVDDQGIAATRVFRGRGDGTFDAPQRVADASLVAVPIDWDQDGAGDLMTVCRGVEVRHGLGGLNFAPPVVLAPAYESGLAPAFEDVDGDGRRDLRVFDRQDAAVFHQKADGTFEPMTGIALGATPLGLAAADFDRDGAPDLVTVSQGGRIDIRFGNGAAGFRDQLLLQDIFDPAGVRAADLNSDGEVDLVVANRGSEALTVHYGQGNGRFTDAVFIPFGAPAGLVAAGDVDGDGRLDLVTAMPGSQHLLVRRSTGATTYAAVESYAIGTGAVDVQAIRLNADSRDDVVVLTATSCEPFVAADSGRLLPAPVIAGGARRMAAADLTGDGQVDLVLAGSNVALLPGNGDGTFATARVLANDGALDVALPDLDKDGDPDLVLALGSRALGTAANDGMGAFDPVERLPVLTSPLLLAVADWKRDSYLDVAFASRWGEWLGTLLNRLPTSAVAAQVTAESAPGTVTLHWRILPDGPQHIVGIDVARAFDAAGPFAVLTAQPLVPEPVMEFTDRSLTPGATAWYQIVVHAADGTQSALAPIQASAGRWTNAWQGVVTQADGSLEVRYAVGPGGGEITIVVHDVRGRVVQQLQRGHQAEGSHRIAWHRQDRGNRPVARGVYFVRGDIGGRRFVSKVVMLSP